MAFERFRVYMKRGHGMPSNGPSGGWTNALWYVQQKSGWRWNGTSWSVQRHHWNTWSRSEANVIADLASELTDYEATYGLAARTEAEGSIHTIDVETAIRSGWRDNGDFETPPPDTGRYGIEDSALALAETCRWYKANDVHRRPIGSYTTLAGTPNAGMPWAGPGATNPDGNDIYGQNKTARDIYRAILWPELDYISFQAYLSVTNSIEGTDNSLFTLSHRLAYIQRHTRKPIVPWVWPRHIGGTKPSGQTKSVPVPMEWWKALCRMVVAQCDSCIHFYFSSGVWDQVSGTDENGDGGYPDPEDPGDTTPDTRRLNFLLGLI